MRVIIGDYPEGDEKRFVDIHIHDYDTWNMNDTLAMIILPMLEQLKATKHGSPHVDDEDIPEHLGIRSTQASPKEHESDIDEHWHKRWDYIINAMIWSFKEYQTDWEDQYWITRPEVDLDALFTEGDNEFGRELKWKVEGKFDREGRDNHAKLIQQGFTLFGKYYLNLWS